MNRPILYPIYKLWLIIVKLYWHGDHSVHSQWNQCISDIPELLYFHRWIVHAQWISLKYQASTAFCNHMAAWISWRRSVEFPALWTKDNAFSLSFGINVLLCPLLQMSRHPQEYTFLPSFFSMSQSLMMTKIRTSLQRKKNVIASKIYALISISFICCDSHILLLQSAKQFYCKIK